MIALGFLQEIRGSRLEVQQNHAVYHPDLCLSGMSWGGVGVEADGNVGTTKAPHEYHVAIFNQEITNNTAVLYQPGNLQDSYI